MSATRTYDIFNENGWARSLHFLAAWSMVSPHSSISGQASSGDTCGGIWCDVRVETQLGYKSVKFLERIAVADEFDELGKIGSLQNGWAWYVGI
ncbi:MAG: hypothetical protein ACYDBZ_12375 [Steroidobacteraceae bacterium]